MACSLIPTIPLSTTGWTLISLIEIQPLNGNKPVAQKTLQHTSTPRKGSGVSADAETTAVGAHAHVATGMAP